MAHKLHITPPDPALSKAEKNKKELANNGYKSPVGWWKVTTEGDCEGRSIQQLGIHYGHVAEIALHLADKCYYSLCFRSVKETPPTKRKTYKATKSEVWFSLDVDSGTWNMTDEYRAKFLRDWFDTEDVEVLTKTEKAASSYYASSVIRLKK